MLANTRGDTRSRHLLSLAATMVVCAAGSAAAQVPDNEDQENDHTPAVFSITPRLQYSFVDPTSLITATLPSSLSTVSASTAGLPFYDLAVQYTPADAQTDFEVYGSYGSGHGSTKIVAVVPTTFGPAGFAGSGTYAINRLELEANGRQRFQDSPAYLLFGIRYEVSNLSTTVPGAIFPDTGSDSLDGRFEQYIAEIGVGVAGSLIPNSPLSFFGNVK